MPLRASAGPDTLVDLVTVPGSAGLGAMLRSERSPYKGAGVSNDLVPLYLYEGKRVFLHGSGAGLKLVETDQHSVNLLLDYRFEGFPYDKTPASLVGMQARRSCIGRATTRRRARRSPRCRSRSGSCLPRASPRR